MSEQLQPGNGSILGSEALQAAEVDEVDKTQSTEEFLHALRQLSNQSAPKTEDMNGQNGQQQNNSGTPQVSTEDVKMHSPPPSEWQTSREHLREKPSDVDSWLKLVDLAEESGDEDRISETYEALLEAFPNTVRTPTGPFPNVYIYLTVVDYAVIGANCIYQPPYGIKYS